MPLKYLPCSQSICRAPKVLATGQVAAGVMRYAQSLVEQHKRHTLRKFEHKYAFQVWAQTHSGTQTINVFFFIFSDEIENVLQIYTNRAVRRYHSPSRRVSGWL